MQTEIAKITETDSNYVAEMIAQFGFKKIKEGFLEVPAGMSKLVHGLEVVESTQTWADQNPEVAEWIHAYSGNSNFFNSLRSQLLSKGSLSEAQTNAIRSQIKNETKKAQIKDEPKEFSLKVGQVVRIGSTYGRKVYKDLGFSRPVFNLEILDIEAESFKAWKVKVRGSAIENGYCGCCGRELSDPLSIANNIGPICAEEWNIPREGDREALKKALEKEVSSDWFWLPKSVAKKVYEA